MPEREDRDLRAVLVGNSPSRDPALTVPASTVGVHGGLQRIRFVGNAVLVVQMWPDSRQSVFP